MNIQVRTEAVAEVERRIADTRRDLDAANAELNRLRPLLKLLCDACEILRHSPDMDHSLSIDILESTPQKLADEVLSHAPRFLRSHLQRRIQPTRAVVSAKTVLEAILAALKLKARGLVSDIECSAKNIERLERQHRDACESLAALRTFS